MGKKKKGPKGPPPQPMAIKATDMDNRMKGTIQTIINWAFIKFTDPACMTNYIKTECDQVTLRNKKQNSIKTIR